jgi:hypothetical protein
MTNLKLISAWVLGVSVLIGGCTTTTTGNGNGNGNGDGTGTPSGSASGSANGTGNGDGSGTSYTSGPRESSLVSIQKAVLTINPGGTCEPQAGASACTACLLANCCEHTQFCMDDHFCVTLAGCMSKCTDNGCVRTCTTNNTDGVEAYQRVMGCGLSDCGSSCGGEI